MPPETSPSYPGLGLPLMHRNWYSANPIFPIGFPELCVHSNSGMLLVREVAMMIVMDRLTDKPDWHRKIFDEHIAGKWVSEALALPVGPLHDEIVKTGKSEWGGCCIKKLRDKACFFETSKLIPTLDADATVVKSDTLIAEPLRDSLRSAFSQLMEDQEGGQDWHPGTNQTVQDLVHPSMFPLVYGRSRVLPEEVVGVANAVDMWAGKGDVIPTPPPPPGPTLAGILITEKAYWSENYQWLPANFAFVEGGGVRFTSYINLHPGRYSGIYRTIEQLVEEALRGWDFCLMRHTYREKIGAGRLTPRFAIPDDPDDGNPMNWSPHSANSIELTDEEIRDCLTNARSRRFIAEPEMAKMRARKGKWEEVREPVQPDLPDYVDADYPILPGATLREQFVSSGLQIIVKMATVELTTEKPTFPAGGWHIEGQMNEHIVGTAIYYLDSENVTPSHLRFRMQTADEQHEDYRVGQDSYTWMERVYGTRLGQDAAPCLQNYGSVETREGRLLAFPNVFQHSVSSFGLVDPTKPGHRRIIVLWLVDPETRIISTANVPPQQQEWWVDSTFGNFRGSEGAYLPRELADVILEKVDQGEDLTEVFKTTSSVNLPAEISAMIGKEFEDDALLMSLGEARGHRDKLIAERTVVQGVPEPGWRRQTYNFCEH